MAFVDDFQQFISMVAPSAGFVDWLKKEDVRSLNANLRLKAAGCKRRTTRRSRGKIGVLTNREEDRALVANGIVSDEINDGHECGLRFRALVSSIAFVSIDNVEWFNLFDREHLRDLILVFLNQKLNKSRASLEFVFKQSLLGLE